VAREFTLCATVVVSPKEYGITRLGTTKPVKVILDVTLERPDGS
jgi:hypothetical protein